MAQLRRIYPNAGTNTLRSILRDQYNMYISKSVSIFDPFFCTNSGDNACRELIRRYLKPAEPDRVAERITNQIVPGTFYPAGVNH